MKNKDDKIDKSEAQETEGQTNEFYLIASINR